MDAYIRNQRHALDYLVTKGHITINKTSVIRLNEHGFLCADGEEDMPRETLLKEPCLFQAGADAVVQEEFLPSLLDSLLGCKPWKDMDTEESYATIISVLNSLPGTTHAAWAALADKLAFTTVRKRSKSALREKLEKACEEEALDWKAFDFFKRACEDGPKLIQLDQAEILLYKLMGVKDISSRDLYGHALLYDAESAESISSLLTLLRVIQRGLTNDSSAFYPLLRRRCQNLESLLKKYRATPRIQQFIEVFIDQKVGNDGNDNRNEGDYEKLQPQKKRRCRKD
ncbi:hypothetical protein CCMA1212_000760 [Trichoderma ghanense]|uniref:Uncharacterized protein n=1 Tax=Trichoderma ghanense TaxID=65468 RepID=A0ABY2HJL1_9HYPO